ncbi:flagellar hook capping protein N-terminal domain protein [Peptoanaerobacter stomatis]|uniref:Basal-body rod modification protein FlgD n=1 Tax=Peptoanaerobacter stomatis TaxID=796937 RepID=J5UC66_9FIRM|nr:flagellar hook capping FlgD N-terminal domain-containing protein [Peptoanaerobacter stomatis]EJU21419.1 flagellar hook capping protein N-terminal domain protein [Peptoanaerobacter stomatis]NWO24742.1 flagellar hook capping protein [Peptostreptococcaceae bacterium oral taxon 081]
MSVGKLASNSPISGAQYTSSQGSTTKKTNENKAPDVNTNTENDKTQETRKKDELSFYDISANARKLRAEQKEQEEAEIRKEKRKGTDKDAFMKLFIAQMKNQDPLEPLKNEQFITQMSQLSSVEQLTKLNTSFEKFSKKFDATNMVKAMEELSKKFDSADLTKAIDNLSKRFDSENPKSEFAQFLNLYEKNNVGLLKKISELQEEIKNLKKA